MQQITEVKVADLHPHEKNPRIDAAQVEDLTESIRTHGVEVPLVVAPRAAGGGYVVLAGHRRLTAVLAAGLPSAPVQIRKDLVAAFDQLAFMATENMHRDQLTPMEEARLFQDMLDLGRWTQADVARATAVKKTRVAERVKLGKLGEKTGEKVHRGQISIDEALVIAEYSDDPDAVEQLESAAGTYNFDFYTSRAVARREERSAREAAEKEVKKGGGRMSDDPAVFVALLDLTAAGRFTTATLDAQSAELDDPEWEGLLRSEHAFCPGHSAIFNSRLRAPVWGCDRADELHPADAEPGSTEPAVADPWDELTDEDFATARVHRETALAKVLPGLDLDEEVRKPLVAKIARQGWTGYGDDPRAIAFLEGIASASGATQVKKVLATWPLSVLVYVEREFWGLKSEHGYLAEGKQGASYWAPSGKLRQLLALIDYSPTPIEERACELATGQPWTAPAEADASAEGGAL